ncbi:MAG TPA: hypothetical protein VME47_14805 [Acetobacteraceae bacterium]|nr:hypothetical protein [Acetobacteraceae bacterium]
MTGAAGDLDSLARCLARPVRFAWLPLPLAEAVLLLAALRTRRTADEAIAATEAAADALRRAAAT